MTPEELDQIGPTNGMEWAVFVSNCNDTYPYITPTGTELAGKSIFITGASKGIGRATAIRCVKAGISKIAIVARSSLDEVVKELKVEAANSNLPEPQILALEVDVTSKESVEAAAKAVNDSFGGTLDILVNNAGYLPDMTRVIDSDPDDWMKGWDVNIKGPYLCSHYLLPMILRSDTKTIVNLTSIGAHLLTTGGSAYQNSRFAICRFTESLAREHRNEGLVVLALHPGAIKTDMADKLQDIFPGIFIDKAELPADTIVWLGKERREWLNARMVSGNWNMEELEKKKDEIVEKDLFKFRITL
ncbi:Glucose/ribitol dehydrogenase [Penicillium cf. griseofulvum]|uniref:Glucose/ribitol dehydrogenase n=1 Tax=Penicillium cf. griseofulvum TaxID=2972120 RepID=A0A9W9JC44_9EURO|nr:Glucose/ribitol dehydrogenase [Penicillium cf. griseofulvum]KAJ5445594.1 Glucose/ribitol dehydrogenase [Penicillium cf. griseofulvum]KAJ5447315.1 Glucose/ribitol dehydrogenase [Penicillium cf. griseofulvum]